jgi:PhnB protein
MNCENYILRLVFRIKIIISLAPGLIQVFKYINNGNYKPIPTFNGNCEETFDFYKSAFGGNFRVLSRFKDMPPMPGNELPVNLLEKIMHVSLPISQETILMGSDSNPMMGNVTTGQNISLSASTASKSDTYKIFNSLSAGGNITMAMADTFWGSYFGMLLDKFGIIWMVSYDSPQA